MVACSSNTDKPTTDNLENTIQTTDNTDTTKEFINESDKVEIGEMI